MINVNAFDLSMSEATDVRIQFSMKRTSLLVITECGAINVTLKPDQLEVLLDDLKLAVEQHGNS